MWLISEWDGEVKLMSHSLINYENNLLPAVAIDKIQPSAWSVCLELQVLSDFDVLLIPENVHFEQETWEVKPTLHFRIAKYW